MRSLRYRHCRVRSIASVVAAVGAIDGVEMTVAYNVKATPIVAPSNGYAALVAGACGAFTVGPWPYAVTLVKIDTAAVHKVELEAICTRDTGAPASQCPYEALWLKQGDYRLSLRPVVHG